MLIRLLVIMLSLTLPACSDRPAPPANERYPWQITHTANTTSIFGIALGQTQVAEAIKLLGSRYKTALFEARAGALALEVYYADFTRAGLSGRLVLTVQVDAKTLDQLRQQAIGHKILESGVKQYQLNNTGEQQLLGLTVKAMTYLPYADLSKEIAKARFGEPTQKIASHAQAEHWLYPDKGLDMILTEEGRDILQYVPPGQFKALVEPLLKAHKKQNQKSL